MLNSNTFDFTPEWEKTFGDEDALLTAVRDTEAQSYWHEVSNKHVRVVGPDQVPDGGKIKEYLLNHIFCR